MADAMLNMMNGMGMLGQSNRQMPQSDRDYRQWQSAPWQSMGMMPDAFSPWSDMGDMPTPASPQSWMGYQAESQSDRIDGFWQGRAGERLIIQGKRFRLVGDEKHQMDGMLQQREHHLLLQARGASKPMLFEYAQQQGRLVLRAADGKLYLYRRMNAGGNSPWHGLRSR